MELTTYVINSFVTDKYLGNPAGVCLLDAWLPDKTLQHVAKASGFSETAFLINQDETYGLRWFTPAMEVPLCGHATLATAYVLAEVLNRPEKTMVFETLSGKLTVIREGDTYFMDFPKRELIPAEDEFDLLPSIGVNPQSITRAARSIIAEFGSQEEVAAIKPDLDEVMKIDMNGIIVTARGDDVDFVSRFFAPRVGVPEDPVTGAAHTGLVPFWAQKLNKQKMLAHQISERGGELLCELKGDRVILGGRAAFDRKLSTEF